MAVPRIINALAAARPSQAAPLSAQAGSQPISPWIQFFIALWTRTGSETGVDAAALLDNVNGLDITDTMANAPPAEGAYPPQAVTVGASPFTYYAPYRGQVLLSGGTVSAVGWARDGATFLDCPTSGFVPVARGDAVKITHTGAPTMTMIGA